MWTAKHRIFLLINFLAVLLLGRTYAQKAPSIEWQKSLGGSNYEFGKCISKTSDGGVIICGTTYSFNDDIIGHHKIDSSLIGSVSDIWVLKFNSVGNVEWSKCIGGSGADLAECIIETSDKGFVIAGQTNSHDGDVLRNNSDTLSSDMSPWIVRINAHGEIIWQVCFDGYTKPWYRGCARSVVETTDGFIVAGDIKAHEEGFSSHGNLQQDAFVLKLSPSGVPIWKKVYGGSGAEFAYSIIKVQDGGYVFAGLTYTRNDGDVLGYHFDANQDNDFDDAWIVKLDSIGNIEWQKCIGGNLGEEAYSIVQTSDMGYVFCGASGSTDGDLLGYQGHDGLWLVKLDSSHNIVWQRRYGGSMQDGSYTLSNTSDMGFIICGYAGSKDGDVVGLHIDSNNKDQQSDAWVLKTDSLGLLEWQKCLGGYKNDVGNSIIQTNDGGFMMLGTASSNDGDVSGLHGKSDFWLVKLGAKAGVKGSNNPTLSSENFYQLFKVYPNPSSNELHLELYNTQMVKGVKLYDIMGRELTLPVRLLSSSAVVDVSSLPNAAYLARITFTYNEYTNTYSLPFIVKH